MNEQSPRRLWTRDFILICLVGLMTSIGMQILNATMTLYADSLGAKATFSGLMATGFALMAAVFRLFSGRFADRRGRRLTMVIGSAIFALSIFGFGAFAVLPALFFFRSIQGIGFSAVSTSAAAAAADVTPRERLGEGLGYFGLGQSLAMAFGPAIGLLFAAKNNFFSLYTFAAVMVVVCLVFSALSTYEKRMHLFDHPAKPAEDAAAGPIRIYRGIWSVIEKKALPASLVYFLICISSGSILAFLPLFAADRHFASISVFYLVEAIGMFIARLFSGRLFDRKGPAFGFVPGLLLGALAFVLITVATHDALFLLAGFIYGVGLGMLMTVFYALAIRDSAVHRRGAASATFNLLIDIGIGLGTAIWGIVIDLMGFSTMYYGSAVCLLAALAISLILFRNRRPAAGKA
jgi:MFS family permease